MRSRGVTSESLLPLQKPNHLVSIARDNFERTCRQCNILSKGYPLAEEYITNSTAGISILVSIISAVQSYLQLGETKSKHETAEIAWQNFYNGIKHELNLRRELRQDPAEYIKVIKADYDRLFEISPICNKSLITKIRKKVQANASPEFQIPNYLRRLKKARHIRKKCYDSLPFLTQMLCPNIEVPHLSELDKANAVRCFQKLDNAYGNGEPFVSYLYALEYILEMVGRQDVLPFINKISCRKRRAKYRIRLRRIFNQ